MTAILGPSAVVHRRSGPALAARHASLVIGALAFIVYLVPAVTVLQLNPDVVEYIDVARRLVHGEGFLLGIKAYHFGGTVVLHDGLAERAPLFPFLAAALLWAGLPLQSLQVLNAALAAGCAVLVGDIGRLLFGGRVGFGSAVLAAASPVVLARLVPPMTEALSIALTLLAVWFVLRGTGAEQRRDYLGAGLALGLAYLTRPTALSLIPAIALGILTAHRAWRRALLPMAAMLAGVLVLVVPMSLYALATRGSLSYSGQTYLYAVHKDSDVLRNGYGRPIPTPITFIAENVDFVRTAMLENARDYAYMLLAEREWLFPLAVAWLGVALSLVRRAYPRPVALPLLVAGTNFATYAATWANFQERYQILTLLLLLPFLVHGLTQLWLDRLALPLPGRPSLLHVAIALVVFWWSPTWRHEFTGEFRYGDESVKARTDDGLRWTGPPRWVEDNELPRIIAWIDQHTERGDVLTHGQPWPYTFFTSRPATLLPTKLTSERLRAFLTDYQVSYVLLDTRDRDRRGYLDDLEALEGHGVQLTASIASFRIVDTRSLWRR
ncbi:MAG: glycosyltransferase family 39 protein [Chloroflexi bacterium]|nr:glycosyltransferase family 39 protein [Chloroflexota bacterium]